MQPMPRFAWWLMMPLTLIVGISFGLRAGYLSRCTDNGWSDTPIAVQGAGRASHHPKGTVFLGQTTPSVQDNLVSNLAEHRWFGCLAPLADEEEATTHLAPSYPWVFGWIASWAESPGFVLRWAQCLLGGLTPIGCFFFARRAFRLNLAGVIAGLLAAVHPFWIANVAELSDGTVTTFFLVMAFALGARGSQVGDPATAALFGIALGGLVMVRAALLPFALLAIVWFLWECRRHSFGWFAMFLVLFSFANVLAPWTIRNYQHAGQPIPVVNSIYLHLWMGNNPLANGSELNEATLRRSISVDRLNTLLAEKDQTRRYRMLGIDCWDEVSENPKATLVRRIQAAMTFLLGEHWLRQREFAAIRRDRENVGTAPEWLTDHLELLLHGSLLTLFVLAFLGWRSSHAWRHESTLATLALLLVPLPFVLSHAESLSGPRLPFDAILICFASYGLIGWLPGMASREPEPSSKEA